jgi:hypothetical protein
MVDQGVVKVGKGGAVAVDETLAKQALDRGLQGNIGNMATAVKESMIRAEATIQDVIKQHADTLIEIPHAQTYANVLNSLSKEYENVGFGEVSAEASALSQKVVHGTLTPKDTLALRRLLDKLRVQRSYVQFSTSPLSHSQQNLKVLSDTLRPKINALPGVEKAMEDYSFSIDSLEALAKEAARRGNNQAISLIDSIFFSGGVAAGEPVTGAGLGVARKVLNSPSGSTGAAQAIEKSGTITQVGAAATGAAAQVTGKRKP